MYHLKELLKLQCFHASLWLLRYLVLTDIQMNDLMTYYICIGNSMVSSAIWKKTRTSEFFFFFSGY